MTTHEIEIENAKKRVELIKYWASANRNLNNPAEQVGIAIIADFILQWREGLINLKKEKGDNLLTSEVIMRMNESLLIINEKINKAFKDLQHDDKIKH